MIEAKSPFSLIIMFVLSLLILRTLYLNLGTFNKLTSPSSYSSSLNSSGIIPPAQNSQTAALNSMEFPKDEGEHQNLQTEWWYFAGHFQDEQNPADKFGLTLIFNKNPARIEFNISDGVAQKNYSSVINIDGYDLLGKDKLAIKKGDIYWLESGVFKYQIHFKFEDKEINLDLTSLKNPFLFSNDTETFYYEQTRVRVSGSLFLSDNHYDIKGVGWVDHQGFKTVNPWKSWRWYALQLDNNVEIAFVTDLTSQTGSFSKKNNLSIFKETALREIIDSQKYSIKDLEYWQDPKTKVKYPVKWQLEIPERNTNLIATSVIADQVIEGANGFYEGTCLLMGTFEGKPVSGRAQFEYQP